MRTVVILASPGIDFWVELRLFEHKRRWLAVADIAGEPAAGWGWSARDAASMALACLGPETAAQLLAESFAFA
jgi:hypothetical protein